MKAQMTVILDGREYVGKAEEVSDGEHKAMLEQLHEFASRAAYLSLDCEDGTHIIFPGDAARRAVWLVRPVSEVP